MTYFFFYGIKIKYENRYSTLEIDGKKAFAMYPEDFKPVDRQEILDFAKQYDISLRDDHLEFMMKYGNAKMFKEDHGEVSFQDFKEYFIEQEKDEDLRLCNLAQVAPVGSLYFGFYAMDCHNIRNDDGIICGYDDEDGYDFHYLNINSILFDCFLLRKMNYFFQNTEKKIMKKSEIDLFCEENKAYKISDLDTYNGGFYYKDQKLIGLRRSRNIQFLYSGGILDELEKNI